MSLASLANELTQPHLKAINGRIGKVPGLLSELREAVSGSSAGDSGGGASSKARILVNAKALDLLNQIEYEVRSAYADRYGQGAPTLEMCIETIGKGEHPADWDTWFTSKFEWCKTQIETLLRPKKMRRLDNVTCPSCQQSKFGEERATALYLDCYTGEHKTLKHASEWEVYCVACEASWTREQMAWLLVALSE